VRRERRCSGPGGGRRKWAEHKKDQRDRRTGLLLLGLVGRRRRKRKGMRGESHVMCPAHGSNPGSGWRSNMKMHQSWGSGPALPLGWG